MRYNSLAFVLLGFGLMGAGQFDPPPGAPGPLGVGKTAYYDAKDARGFGGYACSSQKLASLEAAQPR